MLGAVTSTYLPLLLDCHTIRHSPCSWHTIGGDDVMLGAVTSTLGLLYDTPLLYDPYCFMVHPLFVCSNA